MTSPTLASPPLAERLKRELELATAGLDRRDWMAIVAKAVAAAAWDTTVPKVRYASQVAGAVGRGMARIADSGLKASAPALATSAGRAVRDGVCLRFRMAREAAREAGRDRATFVAWVAGVVAFLLAAGGPDLEGGLPDTDLLFGPGQHRNPFSHTVLIGLGFEFTLRFVAHFVGAVADRLPLGHHPVWMRVAETTATAGRGAFIGMWIGLGAHLFDDANLLSGAVKPYVGLPAMSMEAHQALFAANAAAAAGFAAAEANTETVGAASGAREAAIESPKTNPALGNLAPTRQG